MCENYYSVEKNVSGEIALDDLRISRSGVSDSLQIGQVQFIDAVMSTVTEAGLDYEPQKIYYKNNSGRDAGVTLLDINQESEERQEKFAPKIIEDGKSKITLHHPSLMLFKRLIGSIKLKGFEQDGIFGSIAFSISQRGFELAVGNTVEVCENMCIMQADDRISTFGSDSIKEKDFIGNLRGFLLGYSKTFERNMELINKMKGIPVDPVKAHEIFGKLHWMSNINNNSDLRKKIKGDFLDLPQSVINKAQYQYINEVNIKGRGDSSLWDIANDLTFHHKPENIDSVNIIRQNAGLFEHLQQYTILN